MTEIKCASCGCECAEDEAVTTVEMNEQEEKDYSEDTHFAVLLALVPAMTMSLFNMMGLL